MKKYYIIFTILFLISLSSFACKCKQIRLTPDMYFSYDNIFSGTLDTIIGDPTDSYKRDIVFYLNRVYKGDSVQKITFKNTSTGSCHGSYKKGVSYLIYLKYDKKLKTYTTVTCMSRVIKSKNDLVNARSITDTTWNYDAIKFCELDFLEKIQKIKTGTFEVKLPNGRMFAKGTMFKGLPCGRWFFYDFNGKPLKSKNYWRGRKYKKAISRSGAINFSIHKSGLYAVYLDQSTYTELTINKDGTFNY